LTNCIQQLAAKAAGLIAAAAAAAAACVAAACTAGTNNNACMLYVVLYAHPERLQLLELICLVLVLVVEVCLHSCVRLP
jgi:hypothetical protein